MLVSASQLRVLLVDDNQVTSELVREYLELHGFKVSVAFNGREAVESVTVVNPDIVLMDIQMPEMDGLEAMRLIRAGPAPKSLPVIALTALANPVHLQQCLDAGANEYLCKPMRMKALIERIRHYCPPVGPA